jgi:hypothetical protein
MQKGQRAYTIKYVSPASRIMRTEEMQGLTQSLDVALAAAQGFPEMLDNYDPDKMVKKLNELSGVDEEILRDTETIKAIRESRAKMQQEAVQAQQCKLGPMLA